jgi:hypothetical protein
MFLSGQPRTPGSSSYGLHFTPGRRERMTPGGMTPNERALSSASKFLIKGGNTPNFAFTPGNASSSSSSSSYQQLQSASQHVKGVSSSSSSSASSRKRKRGRSMLLGTNSNGTPSSSSKNGWLQGLSPMGSPVSASAHV